MGKMLRGPILHTNYADYSNQLEVTYNENLVNKQVDKVVEQLEAKEQMVYNKYGFSDFYSFRNEIRNIFIGASQDREVLKRFEANNLNNSLKQFASQTAEVFNQDIIVQINFEKIENLPQYRKDAINKSITETLQLNWNVNNIKRILNQITKAHFSSKNFTKNMENTIRKLRNENILVLGQNIQENGQTVFKELDYSIPNFPWGVTKDMVMDIVDTKTGTINKNNVLYIRLKNAIDRIKNFIFNELGNGATDNLYKAMEKTWEQKMGYNNEIVLLIFFGGGTGDNFMNCVKGALGEFQAALIFNYINLLKEKHFNINITGDIIRGNSSEQGKADITLFNKLGIQVKNYTTTSSGNFLKNIETNVHPYNMNVLRDNMDNDILTFLANFYFNSTFQENEKTEFKTLKQFLAENYFSAIMNFYDVDDNVSFYLISGKYLVPVSHIYRDLYSAGIEKIISDLEITGPKETYSDDYFRETREDKNAPQFTRYWRRLSGYQWTTDRNHNNEKLFRKLVEHDISIRMKFRATQIPNLSDYSIF